MSHSLCKTYFSQYPPYWLWWKRRVTRRWGQLSHAKTKLLDNHGGLLGSTQPWRALEFYTTAEGSWVLHSHGGLLSSTQPRRALEFYTTMEGSWVLHNHGGFLSSTQLWRALEFYTTMEGSWVLHNHGGLLSSRRTMQVQPLKSCTYIR